MQRGAASQLKFSNMDKGRRHVTAVLAICGLLPECLFAQNRTKPFRIGFLWSGEPTSSLASERLDAFKEGMRNLRYVESVHYTIEHRYGRNQDSQLPDLARELASLGVVLIVTPGTVASLAASKTTQSIPILSLHGGDPVGVGLAKSLARPGGNVTGMSSMSEVYSKRLDLLRQVVPNLRKVGFMYDPRNANELLNLRLFEVDCGKLKLTLIRAPVSKSEDVAAKFALLKREQAQGLVLTNAGSLAWRDAIIEQADKQRLPAIYSERFMAEAGGLISYGMNFPDVYRRAAVYVDKIIKGTPPGEIPIEQPTKFELVINMKSAKALGLKIPDTVRVLSTKVIE